MDSSRRPQQRPRLDEGVQAAPFQVLGVNGIGDLPTAQLPAVPDIGIPDQTTELFARGQRSIDNAFQASQSVIESTRTRNQAEAANRTNSGFAQTISGLAGAATAGVELYQKLKQQRQDQQTAQIAIEVEDQVRSKIADLHREIALNAENRGIIPTFRESIREIRQQALQSGADPAVIQEIVNVAYDAMSQVNREQGTRWASTLEETQAALVENGKQRLNLAIQTDLNQLRHGALTTDPNEVMSSIDEKVNTFIAENGLSGVDALLVLNSTYESIGAALGENAAQTIGYAQRQQVLFRALEQANEIDQRFPNNPEARAYHFAIVQQNLAEVGIDLRLNELLETDDEAALRQREFQDKMTVTEQGFDIAALSPEAQNAHRTLIQAEALDLYVNRASRGHELSLYNSNEATPQQRAAYRTYQDFTEAVTTYQGLVQRRREINADVRETELSIEQLLDKVDPDGRLGPAQATNVFAGRLVELVGQRNPELSREAARVAEQVQLIERDNLISEAQDIELQIRNLTGQWSSMGFNLANPADTSRMEQRVSSVEPLLQTLQQEVQAQRALQPAPSNFSQGLPPLPRR